MEHKLHGLSLIKKGYSIKKLGAVIFFSTIAFALASTVWALYIRSFLPNDAIVGLVSSFFILISIISYFLIIPLVESSDKYRLLIGSSIMIVVGYFLYSITHSFILFLILASIMAFLGAIRASALGLLVRSNSKKKALSKNEGFIYTLANVSSLIGPLLVSFLLFEAGLKNVFLVASLFLLFSVLLLKFSKINPGEKRKSLHKKVLINFLGFFKDKHRVKAYFLRVGVTFWWSLVYIYIPLLMIKTLKIFWVGIFLAVVTIPLIFLEYPFGKLASKRGYRKLFFMGFLIPAIFSLLCFLFYQNIYFILASITLASIGLAMLEANTEAYFFDITKGKEEQRYYPPYNTSIDAGHMIGRLAGFLVLFLFPFKYIFLVYFGVNIFLAILSLSIKEVIEQKKKN